MVSLARKNLFGDVPRFLIAQAGIVFAVSLVTIQVGILKGFTRSTTLFIDQSDADLWVASKDMLNFEQTVPIPYQRLSQAEAVEGVDQAEAMSIKEELLRDTTGKLAPVAIIGIEPDKQLISAGKVIQGNITQLEQPYRAIADKTAISTLGLKQVGDEAKIGSLQMQLSGLTQGIQSNASSPFLITSLETAKAYSLSHFSSDSAEPKAPPLTALTDADPIAYILVKAEPGQNLQALQQRLNQALPDTHAYTQAEIAAQTRDYWEKRTSIGFILGMGASVGIVVGMVIVGQILYAAVSEHLREFGTIRAMGGSNWVAYSIVLEQAAWMAVVGYLPGIALCMALGAWTAATQGVLILITPMLAAEVFAVTLLMCIGSSLFVLQKVTHADPAVIFRAL